MSTKTYTPRLAEKYKKEVVPGINEKIWLHIHNGSTEVGKDLFESWREWISNR